MSKCQKFRIFVAVLAAFAAYFAFICRYNLSMLIEEMVVKSPTDLAINGGSTGTTAAPNSLALDHRLNQSTPTSVGRARRWTESRPHGSVTNSLDRAELEFDVSSHPGDHHVSPVAAAVIQGADEAPFLLNWTYEEKNNLLGAFFYTYSLAQVPAGRAAETWGPKAVLLLVGLGTGMGSLLFPFAVRWSASGYAPAYIIRLALGACQAGMFPAIYVLLCAWLPKLERASWLAVPSAMGRIGTISMNQLVDPVLRHYDWQTAFVLSGLATLAWALAVLVFVSDTPGRSRWLAPAELHHIESNMAKTVLAEAGARPSAPTSVSGLALGTSLGPAPPDQLEPASEARGCKSRGLATAGGPSVDWVKVFTNRPLAVLTLVMFSADWTNMLLITKLNGFLRTAMRMEVKETNDLASALVAVYCVGYPLAGALAARLEAAQLKCFHSLNIRKLFEISAHVLQICASLMVALAPDSSRTLVVSALFVMMLGRSAVGGGQCQMPPELSPEFPGTVMAIANSGASISGVVGPMTINWLVEHEHSFDSWRHLWFFSAALYLAAGLIFLFFADNSPQDFAKTSSASRPLVYLAPDYLTPATSLGHLSELRVSPAAGPSRPDTSLDSFSGRPASQSSRAGQPVAASAKPRK